MTSPDVPLGHIDDGELVRYVDNELSVDNLATVRHHLAGCPPCQARFDAIRGRSEEFNRAMAGLDSPPAAATKAEPIVQVPHVPRSPSQGWGWRIAAMVAVVIGVTLTVTPARAWLLEHMGPVGEWFGASQSSQPETPPEMPVSASSVRFVAGDSALLVEFTMRPRAGHISFERGASDTVVSAEVLGQSMTDELVVSAAGLRVVNDAESTADYAVVLPAMTTMVEVRVAGVVVVRYRPDEAARRVDLAQ